LREVLFNLDMNAMDAMASTPDALRSLRICTRATSTGIVEVYLKDHGRQTALRTFLHHQRPRSGARRINGVTPWQRL